MSQLTTIEWTDATWNPARGCSRISPGCVNCYAEAIASRFAGIGMGPAEFTARSEAKDLPPFFGFVNEKRQWTGKVELIESKLAEPQHWRQPRKIFVNSMSDLFHESLSDDAIAHVFKTMYHVNWHTYQVLTKRSARLKDLMPRLRATFGDLRHVWLGVSVEDRVRKSRIYDLQETPAAVRFLSVEPLLEDLGKVDLRGIDWVIIGGESGPGARPCRLEWVQSLMEQCFVQAVPVFFKQAGAAPCIDYYAEGDLRDWALSGKYTVFNHGAEWHERDGQPTPGASFIRVHLRDSKGGNLAELPEQFHERMFPGRAECQ